MVVWRKEGWGYKRADGQVYLQNTELGRKTARDLFLDLQRIFVRGDIGEGFLRHVHDDLFAGIACDSRPRCHMGVRMVRRACHRRVVKHPHSEVNTSRGACQSIRGSRRPPVVCGESNGRRTLAAVAGIQVDNLGKVVVDDCLCVNYSGHASADRHNAHCGVLGKDFAVDDVDGCLGSLAQCCEMFRVLPHKVAHKIVGHQDVQGHLLQ